MSAFLGKADIFLNRAKWQQERNTIDYQAGRNYNKLYFYLSGPAFNRIIQSLA